MNDQEEYLIAYANLKSNLFKYQKEFLDHKKLKKFYKYQYFGFPICLPQNVKYFDYTNATYFKIKKKFFAKKIFNTLDLNYIGVKKFFRYGDIFASNVKLKEKYKKKLYKYKDQINLIKKKIKIINSKSSKVCAMQLRNVPHFGHEAVFKFILSKFDYLYLNPIYGIKKKNDFSDILISKALNLIKKKYKNVKFDPIWTNFHYAGPREALHHMIIRENLGFKYFYVGRDHAGAENLYNLNDSIKAVNKFKLRFKIKPFISKGGFFCEDCGKYVIKDKCPHKDLKNISGTEFRECLYKKNIYKHADKNMQKILFKFIDK